jgi:hypothetical protein
MTWFANNKLLPWRFVDKMEGIPPARRCFFLREVDSWSVRMDSRESIARRLCCKQTSPTAIATRELGHCGLPAEELMPLG